MTYQPPFHLTHTMTKRVAEISELIGAWKAVNQGALVPELRRDNRIKTIQASLAVEQNTLSVEQVTAVLEGKTVLGLPREIQEVRNAFATYEKLEQWQPQRLDDLLNAHSLLMHGLVDDAGRFRSGGSGIYQGQQLVHMAPPQQDYYRLLGEADKQADCSAFIEFLLQSIQESLHEAISQQSASTPVKVRATTETQILDLLSSHPELSLSAVAATIGRSLRAVERAVAKLKIDNRLVYEGSKKGGRWKVLQLK